MNLAPYAWSFLRCENARTGEFYRPLERQLTNQMLIFEAKLACCNPETFSVSQRLDLLGRMVNALELLEACGVGNSPQELSLAWLIATARQVLCTISPVNDRIFVRIVRHVGLVLEFGDLTLRLHQPEMRLLH